MYFIEAGKIDYDNRVVTDITKRTNIIKELIKNEDFFFKYVVKSGDTPETLAFDFYSNPQHAWIIFLANEIYDPLYQWYMTYNEVVYYSKLKYGDPDYQYTQYWLFEDVKYTIDPNGLAESITNLDVEIATNDAKQEIKMIYPEYVNQMIREYKGLI